MHQTLAHRNEKLKYGIETKGKWKRVKIDSTADTHTHKKSPDDLTSMSLKTPRVATP